MRLRHYLKIYRIFINNGFSYEAQYRADTWMKLISNLFYIALLFITIEVVFTQTGAISGWTKEEVYLMAIFWVMADELFIWLFRGGLEKIPDAIADGELDVYLTKPTSTLFLMSCKYILTRGLYRFITQVIIFIWILYRYQISVHIEHALLGFIILITAVFIDYSRVLIANTFGFWFHRIDNVNSLIGQVGSLGRFPLTIWPKTVRILFLTALPVAFSGFMPAATFVGKWPWYGIAYAMVFCIVLFAIAVKFWNFALRRYSSASS